MSSSHLGRVEESTNIARASSMSVVASEYKLRASLFLTVISYATAKSSYTHLKGHNNHMKCSTYSKDQRSHLLFL